MLTKTPQDRENELRFGATPVPGEMAMPMAGQGLTFVPLPRLAYHNSIGSIRATSSTLGM